MAVLLNSTAAATHCYWQGVMTDYNQFLYKQVTIVTGCVSLCLGAATILVVSKSKQLQELRYYKQLLNYPNAVIVREFLIFFYFGYLNTCRRSDKTPASGVDKVCIVVALLDQFLSAYAFECLTRLVVHRLSLLAQPVRGTTVDEKRATMRGRITTVLVDIGLAYRDRLIEVSSKYIREAQTGGGGPIASFCEGVRSLSDPYMNMLPWIAAFHALSYSTAPFLGIGSYAKDFDCLLCNYNLILPEEHPIQGIILLTLLCRYVKPMADIWWALWHWSIWNFGFIILRSTSSVTVAIYAASQSLLFCCAPLFIVKAIVLFKQMYNDGKDEYSEFMVSFIQIAAIMSLLATPASLALLLILDDHLRNRVLNVLTRKDIDHKRVDRLERFLDFQTFRASVARRVWEAGVAQEAAEAREAWEAQEAVEAREASECWEEREAQEAEETQDAEETQEDEEAQEAEETQEDEEAQEAEETQEAGEPREPWELNLNPNCYCIISHQRAVFQAAPLNNAKSQMGQVTYVMVHSNDETSPEQRRNATRATTKRSHSHDETSLEQRRNATRSTTKRSHSHDKTSLEQRRNATRATTKRSHGHDEASPEQRRNATRATTKRSQSHDESSPEQRRNPPRATMERSQSYDETLLEQRRNPPSATTKRPESNDETPQEQQRSDSRATTYSNDEMIALVCLMCVSE